MKKCAIIALVLIGGIVVVADAGELMIVSDVDPYDPGRAEGIVYVKHIAGADEGYDIYDDLDDLHPPSNYLLAYSVIPGYSLRVDARPPESTTRYKIELGSGTVNIPNPYNEWLSFWIKDESNFEWKNIVVERYDKDVNIDDPNVASTGIWDVKYNEGNGAEYWFITHEGPVPFPGVYAQLKVNFYNHADLNRDKKVNLKDYAIFANNFGRTDPNCGADPNNLDDYSDINRSGVVDYNDLSLFSNEWLWDANDPNTW